MLDRHVCTVIKDGKFYIFPNKDTKLLITEDKYIKEQDVHELISDVYGLNDSTIMVIIMEWKRDKIIYHNMNKSMVKYWDYITLPLYSKETEESIYNF